MSQKKFVYYNDDKDITLKEYGRNVQRLVEYIVTIEDKEKRSSYARTLIELMRQLNPALRDSQDYNQKLWDHLYIMSDFKLDVFSPYPMPERSILGKKPQRVGYNTHNLNYKHYGRNIELLIDKAIKLENADERLTAATYIWRLMKTFYSAWNKENIEDDVIVEQLKKMSAGKLNAELEIITSRSKFEPPVRDWRSGQRDLSGKQQNKKRPIDKRKNK